jgi:hypothetical protein
MNEPDTERAAFEAWASANFVSAPPGAIDFNQRQWRLMFDAWQARAAIDSRRPIKDCGEAGHPFACGNAGCIAKGE